MLLVLHMYVVMSLMKMKTEQNDKEQNVDKGKVITLDYILGIMVKRLFSAVLQEFLRLNHLNVITTHN